MNVQYALLAVTILSTVAALATATPSSYSSTSRTRGRRRVSPSRDMPMTPEDLHFECSVQGWTQCLEAVQVLWNSSQSSISNYVAECIATNDPHVYSSSTSYSPSSSNSTSTSVPRTATYGNVNNLPATPPAVQIGEEGETSSSQSISTAYCNLTMDDRAIARQEVYCSQLFLIDLLASTRIRYMSTLRDYGCVDEYSSNGYRTPTQIINSFTLWLEEMVEDHSSCCVVGDRTFIDWHDSLDSTAIEDLDACPIQHGRYRWDLYLSQMAWLVRTVELMEGLGRRRRCLRGCVSAKQVHCTNLIRHFNFLL